MNWARLVSNIVVLSAVLTFAGIFFLIAPEYESEVMFCVDNSNLPFKDTPLNISSGALSTSCNLVDSYIVILDTREILVDVIDYAGASLSYLELREMIASEAVNETEIFKVTVTSTDPHKAECSANAIPIFCLNELA